MSRREPGIDIVKVINDCAYYKDEMSKIKKLSTPLEAQIKEYALKNNMDNIESDKYKAKITTIPKQEFNEDKAIEILKEKLPRAILAQVVKTKAYIDEDALEKLIYNDEKYAKLLSDCVVEKEPTIRLTINKLK